MKKILLNSHQNKENQLKKIFLLLAVFSYSIISSQENTATVEPIEINRAINPDVDTILHRTLPKVNILEKGRARTAEEEEAYQKLKRKVIKLYPYALLAKQIHETTNQNLNSLESNRDKRKYRKEKEKELRDRFENEIKALYTTDGPVLVKLIHRETGKTTYELLRESKSWFNCTIYQIAAKNHGYSLKDTYDAIIDKDIENIVTLLKSEGQLPVYTPM